MKLLKIQNISICLSVLVVILVFIGAAHVWEYGDDYMNIINLKEKSPMSYIFEFYFINDGRHLSPFGIIQMYLIKYTNAPLAVFVYLLSLFFSAWLILKILFDQFSDIVVKREHLLLFYAVICISLWPLYKDVVYWLTGGVYLIALLQGVILVYTVLNYYTNFEKNNSLFQKTFIALIVFLLGLNTQNLSLPIFFLVITLTIKVYHSNSRYIYYWFAIVLLPLITSMLVTNLAPGNFERFAQENKHLGSIVNYITAGFWMYYKFFNYSKLAMLAGFIFGLYVSNYFLSYLNKGNSKVALKNAFLCFILAIISMSPFLIAPDIARIRVYFFGMLFLALSALNLGVFIGFRFRPNKNLNALFINAFLIYGIVFFIWQLSLMIPLSHQVSDRKKYLESVRGSSNIIEYPALEIPANLYLIRWADAKRHKDWNKTKEYFELGGYIEVEKNNL